MRKTFFALVGGLTLGLAAAAFAAPVPADEVEGACKPTGASCKFGSECCSKICKASYTCK